MTHLPLTDRGQLRRLLVGAEQHVENGHVNHDGGDQPHGMKLPVDGRANLVNAQRHNVRQKALVSNGERRPSRAVHLLFDGTHGREARRAKQIEGQEGITRQPSRESRVNAIGIKDLHCADDVLLRDKSRDGAKAIMRWFWNVEIHLIPQRDY